MLFDPKHAWNKCRVAVTRTVSSKSRSASAHYHGWDYLSAEKNPNLQNSMAAKIAQSVSSVTKATLLLPFLLSSAVSVQAAVSDSSVSDAGTNAVSLTSTSVEFQDSNRISDAELQRMIELYKKDPSYVSRYPEIVDRLSPKQFGQMVEGMGTTHFTYLYPMIVRANTILPVLQNEIKDLSLMTVKDGKLEPIPFQIDELDQSGLVWMPKYSKHPIEGKENYFDESDELLFMFRDAGTLAYDENSMGLLEQGKVLQEIVVTADEHEDRFVYLVVGNERRSEADYVSLDISTGDLDTTYLTMNFNPDNFIELTNITAKVGPGKGKNLVESVHLEVSTGILNKNLRVKFSSGKNIHVKALAVKDGPIRATNLIEAKVKLGLMTVMKDRFNINNYEQAFNMRTRFSGDSYAMAKYASFILKEPEMKFFLDFAGLEGGRISFQSIADAGEYPVIDGTMSPLEYEINERRLPGDWLWINSSLGWDLFLSNQLPVVPGGLFDNFLEGMELNLVYQDGVTDLPDAEYAGGPRIGVHGKGLPTVALKLMSAMKDVPFDEINTFETMLDAFIELDDKGKLKKVDKIIRKVLADLKEQGIITSPQQFADAYIKDVSKIGVKGITRADLNEISHAAIVAIGPLEEFSIGAMMRNIQTIATERGVDISKIQYAPRDNTMYFPDTVGLGGPEAFHEEVSTPPEYRARQFPPKTIAQNASAL